MVTIAYPKTLLKTGIFHGDLEKAVKKFNPNVEYLDKGLGNTVKYGCFENTKDPYLFIISQQKDEIVNKAGFNTCLSIISYEEKTNLKIFKEFTEASKITLNVMPPEWLLGFFMLYGPQTFLRFEENPEFAMSLLKRG
jgi:hypothetical protein